MAGLFGWKRHKNQGNDADNKKTLKEFKKLVKDKKYDRALRLGTQYLLKIPNDHDVLFTVGGIHYLNNRYAKAMPYFERALEISEYDIDVLLLKAYSHQKLGQDKRCIQCCNKITEIDPKNKQVMSLLNLLPRSND